jgi:hypothetical protein
LERISEVASTGTTPGAGNGTCGSQALSSGLHGASYTNSFAYTHLGQLWQGPLNGGSTTYQLCWLLRPSVREMND